MDRRFVVRAKVDLDCCRALWKAMQGKARIIRWILWLMMVAVIAQLWQLNRSHAVLFTVLFAVLIFRVLIQPRRMFKNVSSAGNEEAEYVFEEDCLHMRGAHSEGTADYGGFVKLLENKRYYFLFIRKNMAYVLPKSAFVEGDPAEFGAFLTEKCSKPVGRCWSL